MSKRTGIGLLGIGLLVAVVAGVLFFLFPGREAYRDSLPPNLQAIARLDANSLREYLPELLTESQAEVFANSGIDVAHPLYVFVDDADCLGILLPLHSGNQWKKFLQTKGIVTERQRGLYWASHDQWLMVFSDDRCLMCGPLSEQEIVQARARMAALMKQSREEDDMLVEYVEQTDAPLCTVLSFQFAKRLLARFLPSCAAMWREDPNGCLSMDIHLNARRITADVSVHSLSRQRLLPFLTPISPDCLPPLGKELMATMVLGLDGDALLATLRGCPSVRTALLALNFCLDLDQMIRSLDGPVTLSVPDDDDVLSGSFLTAQLKDTRFMQNSEEWAVDFPAGWGIRMDALGDSAFCVRMSEREFCFGVKDQMLIVASSEQAFQAACPANRMACHSKTQPADCLLCMQLSIHSLLKHVAVLSLFVDSGERVEEHLRAYDTFVLRLRDDVLEE